MVGTAVSIFGVVPSRIYSPSNVSFTIDGSEKARGIANANEREYNKTLFHADNLPNSAHTLSIQTHGDALFIVSIRFHCECIRLLTSFRSLIT